MAEGDTVTGVVICRKPFGLFLDIGFGSNAAALLLVPEFTDAHVHSYDFDEYPLVGDSVTARIRYIAWDDHKIALTQNQTYDVDSQSWTRPERGVR
ncbi:MAG: S1 RNA-binding domain-containing protein [Rhodopirellula sp. JB055]|uniref:S1 RNA-binding domain-containing protein n=1 Tax=Rhodopirellula sp. JB055 TaxID=3342846 RepID=UPI00370B510D